MNQRVWRQLLLDARQPRTAAQDSVLRLALWMFATDPRSNATLAQREWVLERLAYTPEWRRFSAQEKARIREPVIGYMKEHRPGIVDIVTKQFVDGEEG